MLFVGCSFGCGVAARGHAQSTASGIMSFRVIESLGWRRPGSYTFAFWLRYCERVRGISAACGVDLRTVDKALWQYSLMRGKTV